MMDEIQPADPEARRKAMWVVGITTMLGVCAMLVFEYFRGDVEIWLERNIGYLIQRPGVVFVAALGVILPVLAAGIYLFLFGTRIIRSQRFPPPNHTVSRDTRVMKGLAAVRRGRTIQLLAVLVSGAAGAIPFVVWAILRALGKSI